MLPVLNSILISIDQEIESLIDKSQPPSKLAEWFEEVA